jgi:hypothetical protein
MTLITLARAARPSACFSSCASPAFRKNEDGLDLAIVVIGGFAIAPVAVDLDALVERVLGNCLDLIPRARTSGELRMS